MWIVLMSLVAAPSSETSHTLLVIASDAKEPSAGFVARCPAPCTQLVHAAQLPKDAEAQTAFLAEARKAWDRANHLAMELRIPNAVRAFEEALALFARGAPMLDTYDEYARCLVDLAAALVAARQEDAAQRAFQRALTMNSTLRLDTGAYSPEVLRVWNTTKQAMRRQGVAAVSIVGKPEGAVVRWDGKLIGTLPVTIPDALVGEHWLTVLHPAKQRLSLLVSATHKTERVEIFMPDVELPPETIILRGATLSLSPAPEEETRAYAALADRTGSQVIVAVASHGRARRWERGAGTVSSVTLDNAFAPSRATTLTATRSASAPVALAKADLSHMAPRTVHPVIAALPFGVGQFAARRWLAGSLFLVTEAALLATNLGCSITVLQNRQSDGTYNDASRMNVLAWIGNAALIALAAEIIVGVVDGELHREVAR